MSEFYELTNDYYLNCTSNCAAELAEIRETLISLDSEYSSKDDLENNLDEITEDLEKQAENERVPGQDSRL